MNQDFFQKLLTVISEEKIKQSEPMSEHTSFRIGGPAEFFVSPKTEEEAAGVLALCWENKIPCFVMGNGSNLLVSDAGVKGVVLRFPDLRDKVEMEKRKDRLVVRAGAGVSLAYLAREVLKNAGAGFEFAAGIPGSVGGAVYMNAGAYGGEIRDVLTSVRVVDRKGQFSVMTAKEMNLSYRHSSLMDKDLFVCEAEFSFSYGDIGKIQDTVAKQLTARREKQPLEYPSAGSTFKRPEGYFAGKLIMDAGLAGFCVNGARVSEKHCGFVVNTGNATAADVVTLMEIIIQRVKEQFGVTLEPEVKFLGEF